MARTLDIEVIDSRRETSELMLISTLLQDLSLISEVPLISDDFSTPKNKFYFNLCDELSKRYRDVNEFTIVNFLQSSKSLLETFEDFGGSTEFNNIKEMTSLEDFGTYLDEVVKYRLIQEFEEKMAIDINKEVVVNGKKIIPSDKFPSWSADQVLAFYEMQSNSINKRDVRTNLHAEYLYYSEEEIAERESGEDSTTTYFDITMSWEDDKGNYRYNKDFNLFSKALDGLSIGNGIHLLAGFSGAGKSTTAFSIALGLIESGEKVMIVSNEMQSRYFKDILITKVCNNVFNCHTITRQKVKKFDFTEKEREVFLSANEYIKDYYSDSLIFYSVSSFNIDEIIREARKNNLAFGYRYCFIETFKAENALNNSVNELVYNSIKLDEFGKQMGMGIFLPMQLMPSQKNKVPILSSWLLSGSKSVIDVCCSVSLMRRVLPKELNPDEPDFFLNPYVWRKDESTGKMVKKYFKVIDSTDVKRRSFSEDVHKDDDLTIDKSKAYNLVFVDKSRESSDTNKIILQEMNGAFGSVRDIGYVDMSSIYDKPFFS